MGWWRLDVCLLSVSSLISGFWFFCLALLAGRLFFSLQGLGLSVDIEGPLSSLFPCLSYEEREISEGEREKGGKSRRERQERPGRGLPPGAHRRLRPRQDVAWLS